MIKPGCFDIRKVTIRRRIEGIPFPFEIRPILRFSLILFFRFLGLLSTREVYLKAKLLFLFKPENHHKQTHACVHGL